MVDGLDLDVMHDQSRCLDTSNKTAAAKVHYRGEVFDT